MTYRTKTYIAGDWTGDEDLIQQLYKWNESNYWGLHFTNAHELNQARDSSLACSIKKSLAERLDASKTFVLIVGEKTNKLTAGSCQHCASYSSWTKRCVRNHYVDYRSYIEYECEKADRDGIRIVVIYNYESVHKELCPEVLRYKGEHIRGYYITDGNFHWNYDEIKSAIMDD